MILRLTVALRGSSYIYIYNVGGSRCHYNMVKKEINFVIF